MTISYKNTKKLPCDMLYELFLAVGWAREETTTPAMMENFNIAFLNSTFVFSAWDGEKLVGCVRALSDLHFRSVIFDLAVLPEYQKKGIGRELINLCRSACPDSEWLVQTDEAKPFYERIGFNLINDHFLKIRGKWF